MDQLGSKDSSHDFQLNYVISYFLPTFTTSCMDLKIDVMERKWKNFNFWSASKQALTPCLVPPILSQIPLCKKKILRYIKISANAWSTKYWWNQKLIAQFCYTLRDEHFKPI
jgi:hypothetical protein